MTNFLDVYYNPILIVIRTDLFIVVKTQSLLARVKQTKLDYFSMPFRQIKARILAILLLTFLASCSTKQAIVPATQDKAVTEIEEVSPDSGALSAEQRVSFAQTLEGDAAVSELIAATTLFYQQENYPKALWLADKVLPLIDNNNTDNTKEKVKLVLIKISSLQKLGYYEKSHIHLTQFKLYTTDNHITLTDTYYQLLSEVFKNNKQPTKALNAQLFAFSLAQPSSQSPQQIEDIWADLQNLSQWQLNLLALDNAPHSKGWLQLTALANKFGSKQKQMHYHLTMFQKKFKRHPARLIARKLATETIIPKNIENIAVILPLSGKNHPAGLAIQQGVLASFANNQTKKLHFLDSNIVNWYGLTAELSHLKIDYVIGPLLKSNVDKYINHTSAQTQSKNDSILNASAGLFDINKKDDVSNNAIKTNNSTNNYLTAIDSDSAIKSYLQPTTYTGGIDTLLLNIPSKASLTNQHTVLSMRPEDEAMQAAATLSRQDFKKPIVLSQKNIVSKRIAQAFAQQWKRITGNAIDVVYYETGAQMQANIKTSLGVDTSKARINKLKSRLNQNITAQTRNRRDIDMIYLVGTPEQTRLVKPYIEVNVSPFAKKIPVYASSRSHSTQSDYSSNSDLQGLTFTEIPWLLEGVQNTELASLSQQLWPKRSDSLSRLFAMGYDSYQLINKIPLMQQAPYLQHWGQTGVLKLGDNNILTRSLFWGSYKHNKVVSIVME